MKKYFIEIQHRPFRDGTPRHPLVTLEIIDPFDINTAKNILDEFYGCESDGVFDFYELFPNIDSYVNDYNSLMKSLGIHPTMYVEIFLKVANG